MKNRFKLGLLLAVMVIAVAAYYIVEKNSQSRFAGLVLDNIEALAEGEGEDVGYACLEDGSLNCRGIRAKYMVELRSLRK